MEKDYDTLVLSGGGIKGFCLLGGVQSLIDMGKLNNIDKFIGTSVGAIICYFLAIGYKPIEIIVELYLNKFFEKMAHFNLVEMINGNGAIGYDKITESLEKLTLCKIGRFLTLGKLKEIYGKTLICCTYNTSLCTTEYLSPENSPDLPCLTALRMSSNIPLIFERFKYMDNYYIDGGIVDNFPISKGIEIGEKAIGLHLDIDEKSFKDRPEDGMATYIIRLLYIPMIHSSKIKFEEYKNKATIISIPTEMKNIVDFDIKSKIRLDMFSIGYESVKKNFKEEKNDLPFPI